MVSENIINSQGARARQFSREFKRNNWRRDAHAGDAHDYLQSLRRDTCSETNAIVEVGRSLSHQSR